MNSNSLAILSKALAEITDTDRAVIEARKADRAQRLAELLQSDVWKLDIYPMLRALHDEYLDAVKRKLKDPETLMVFDDFLTQVDGAIRVGAGAMERLAARRAKAAEIKTKINQAQQPTALVNDAF